ncbi:MAG TPA: hypothetical protein VMT20_20110 [Terriglobia bacterium]|nr:hypothetical protein [Terriglobia bacterium]
MVQTWSEILPNGAQHPAFPPSASTRSVRWPVRKPQNSISYERTCQPIENKGHEFLNPVNLLKVKWLALLSRQVIENKLVSLEKPVIKNSNPVNLLKLNRVSSAYLVNSLKIKRVNETRREAMSDRCQKNSYPGDGGG